MNLHKFTFLALLFAFFATLWGQTVNETRTFNAGYNGDTTVNNTGVRARVQAYVLGGGGAGQAGIGVVGLKYTGSSGGGAGAAYLEFEVSGKTSINVIVGAGGLVDESSGVGGSGNFTSVKWNSRAIYAHAGQGGKTDFQGGINGCWNFEGSSTDVYTAGKCGERGSDGGSGDLRAVSNGGKAGWLTILGQVWGGGLGATQTQGADFGAGGRGGYPG
ncbi:MAG: hypothetical protein FWC26_02115, partial [Fibromonadales bacterium]|nr:hypothetical protein [Fibromonadales bacterium]